MARFDLNAWRDDIQALQHQLAAYIPSAVSSVKSAQHEKYASRAPSPTTVEEVFDPLTKALGGRPASTKGRGGSASGGGTNQDNSGSAANPSPAQDKGQSQPPPASRPEDIEIGEGAFNPKTTSQPAEIAIGEGAFNPAPVLPPARSNKSSQPSRPFSQFLSALPRGVGRAAEEAAKALSPAVVPLASKAQELVGQLPPAEEVLKKLLAQSDANAFVQPAPSLTPDEEFDKYFLNPSPDSAAGKDLAAMMSAQMFGPHGMAPDTPKGSVAPVPLRLDDIFLFGGPSAAGAPSSGASGTGPSASATLPVASSSSSPSGPTSSGPVAGATAPTPALPSTPGTQVVMAHDGTPYEIHTVSAGDYKTAYENLASLGVSGADAARVFATAQQASKPVEVTDKLGLSGTGTRVIVSRGNIHVLNDVSDKPEDYWSSVNLGTIPRNIRGLLGYGGIGPAFQFGSQLSGTPLPPWAMGMFNPYAMMGPMGMNPMGMGMFMDPMMMYMLMMGMSGMFNPPATPQPIPGSPFG